MCWCAVKNLHTHSLTQVHLSQRVSNILAPPDQETMPPSGRYPYTLTEFMAELRRNEPNQRDVQKKLSNVLLAALEELRRGPQPSTAEHIPTQPGAEGLDWSSADLRQTSQLRQRSVEFICKMCDQMLFMMVEWARGARFFRELKVGLPILTINPLKGTGVNWLHLAIQV